MFSHHRQRRLFGNNERSSATTPSKATKLIAIIIDVSYFFRLIVSIQAGNPLMIPGSGRSNQVPIPEQPLNKANKHKWALDEQEKAPALWVDVSSKSFKLAMASTQIAISCKALSLSLFHSRLVWNDADKSTKIDPVINAINCALHMISNLTSTLFGHSFISGEKLACQLTTLLTALLNAAVLWLMVSEALYCCSSQIQIDDRRRKVCCSIVPILSMAPGIFRISSLQVKQATDGRKRYCSENIRMSSSGLDYCLALGDLMMRVLYPLIVAAFVHHRGTGAKNINNQGQQRCEQHLHAKEQRKLRKILFMILLYVLNEALVWSFVFYIGAFAPRISNMLGLLEAAVRIAQSSVLLFSPTMYFWINGFKRGRNQSHH